MTENMPPPDGRIFVLRINLRTHAIEWVPSQGEVQSWRMPRGLTANQLAEQIVGVLEHNGLKGEYAQQKFESDEPREYNPAHALTFFSALVNVEQAFRKHRASLSSESEIDGGYFVSAGGSRKKG